MNFSEKNFAIFCFLTIFLASCGDDSGSSAKNFESIENKSISGVAQLGPFEKGATVAAFELDEEFKPTGRNYQTEIENDWGEYSIKVKNLKTQYVLLKADGYYYSYITGKTTKERISLNAFTDLNERNGANINVFSHLIHKRVQYLIATKKKSFEKAEEQAISEILKIFGYKTDIKAIEDLDFFGEDEQSAIGLAISILMQGDLTPTNLEKRLDDFSKDFEEDGVLDNDKLTKLADWAYLQYIFSKNGAIRENIEKLHPTASIPSFETTMDNFWWQNYGLGSCEENRKNNIKKNQNSGSEFNEKLFICRPSIWRPASESEIQKYYWPDDMKNIEGKDGDTYQSPTDSTTCYIYEGKWRKGYLEDCTLGLPGCTKDRQLEIRKASDDWYICDNQKWYSWHSEEINGNDDKWKISITNEKDTAGWKSAKQGTIRKGNKSDIVYIFDNNAWRLATIPEATIGGCTAEIQDSIGYAEILNGQYFVDSIATSCVRYRNNYSNVCPKEAPSTGYYSCTQREECSTPFYQNGYYHCDNGKWHWVSDCFVEMKKLSTKKAKDGDSQWGKKCTSKCYVFESDTSDSTRGSWRFGDITECVLGLGGCTKKRRGETKFGPYTEISTNCDGYYCWKYIKPLDKDAPQDAPYYCRYEDDVCHPHEWR